MKYKNSIWIIGLVAGLPVLAASSAENKAKATERLELAGTVFEEIMSSKDQSIPEDLVEKAKCAVIVPGLKKGGFILSAKYGKGFITCRRENSHHWSAPAAVRVEGGGVGFQIGASETDLILLVMGDRGAKRLLSSQFTVGAEGEVAAGPVGRNASAQTDAKFTAEILSWSRSRGAFAGLALQGATLREDKEDNEALYGMPLSNEQVIHSEMPAPAAAKKLLHALREESSK